ncbi:MAG: hypothetical protein ACNA8H_04375 [Anaerolineales bacterium]
MAASGENPMRTPELNGPQSRRANGRFLLPYNLSRACPRYHGNRLLSQFGFGHTSQVPVD